MTAYAIVTGSLWKPPEPRTSKAGNPFVTATIRAKDGDAAQWWKIVAFSEDVQTELMRLVEGDVLSVQGSFKAELYTAQNGETKISLSIIADNVLPLKKQPKEREVKPFDTHSRRERCAGSWAPGAGPNDEIPG